MFDKKEPQQHSEENIGEIQDRVNGLYHKTSQMAAITAEYMSQQVDADCDLRNRNDALLRIIEIMFSKFSGILGDDEEKEIREIIKNLKNINPYIKKNP